MNAQELFHALTVLSDIPLGSKEQRVLSAIAIESDGIGFKNLLSVIGGEPHSMRQLISRLKSKGMIESARYTDDSVSYGLSKKGKTTIAKVLKP